MRVALHSKSERGIALLIAVGILAVLAALGVGFYSLMASQTVRAVRNADFVRAEMMAHAGISDGVARLRQEVQQHIESANDEWFSAGKNENGARPISYEARDKDGQPLGYTRALASSAGAASDRYSLRISDPASRIDLNACDNLGVLLENLCRVLGAPLAEGDGQAIAEYRSRFGRFHHIEDIKPALGAAADAKFGLLRETVTVDAPADPYTLGRGIYEDFTGTRLTDRHKTWIAHELKGCVLALSGDGREQRATVTDNGLDWLEVDLALTAVPSKEYTLFTEDFNAPRSFQRAAVNVNTASDIVLAAVLMNYSDTAHSVTLAASVARETAQKIIAARKGAVFTAWNPLKTVLGDQDAGAKLVAPQQSTTELTFNSGGVFSLESTGQVARRTEVYAQVRIEAVVRIYDVWRQTTALEFKTGANRQATFTSEVQQAPAAGIVGFQKHHGIFTSCDLYHASAGARAAQSSEETITPLRINWTVRDEREKQDLAQQLNLEILDDTNAVATFTSAHGINRIGGDAPPLVKADRLRYRASLLGDSRWLALEEVSLVYLSRPRYLAFREAR